MKLSDYTLDRLYILKQEKFNELYITKDEHAIEQLEEDITQIEKEIDARLNEIYGL